ncbi:uncharacterized protein LOC127729018 [Mytilus californianus]|uniref:uncharacterized protein LOC127729018 n=1 Tax=Mytilus californianus TaxID=6549 RepID=UPI002247E80F|nr:uncharacterized protein LOC127729018 [Mytilus californianus]
MVSPEIRFESPWYNIEAQNTAHKNLIIRHNLGEYPVLVDVQIKIQKNGKDFIFTGIGSAHRDDDANNSYGGTVYIYNKTDIFLTFPLKNNNFGTGGLAYTDAANSYKEINHSLGFYPDIVSVRTHLGNGYVSDAQGMLVFIFPS